jgi:GAF domain-containing protein
MELAIHWNGYFQRAGDNIFELDACWSFRRGRVHLVENIETGPICRHLNNASKAAYTCIPLVAKGEVLGLLHLQAGQNLSEELRKKNH